MKNTCLISFFLFMSILCFSQDSIRISGQFVNNSRFAKIVIQKFGIGVFDIAAVPIEKETGKFSISAPRNIEPGIYRFRYSQTGIEDYVDVIINGIEKDISFDLDVNKEPANRYPMFTASEENKAWYQFNKQQKESLNAIRIQQDFLFNYPNKKDKSSRTILGEFEKAKKVYQKQYDLFVSKTPYYWAKANAQYSKVYFTNISEHPRIQMFDEYENYWRDKPTTEAKLLNSPLYTDAILSYIKFYMNPDIEFGLEEQNNGYRKCIDNIIQLCGKDEATKEFTIKYLQLGFKELGNEEILQYIDEKYAATAQCSEDGDELKKRLAGYEALKPGNLAPKITLMGPNGKVKTLFDFEQDTILLVFWASWCPHCLQEMPKLQNWAKEHPGTLVLAVSLDEDYTLFQNTIKDFPNMLHYCDLQKWEGEIVKNYFIAATPTFFEINKERKIVKKFIALDDIVKNN